MLTRMNLWRVLLCFQLFSHPFYLRNVFIALILMLLNMVGISEWGDEGVAPPIKGGWFAFPPHRWGLVCLPPTNGGGVQPPHDTHSCLRGSIAWLGFSISHLFFLKMGNWKPSFVKIWFRLSKVWHLLIVIRADWIKCIHFSFPKTPANY